MLAALLWYGVVTLVGWMAFPLAYRFLPQLPDRGYAFSRSIGLLLWGYVFWLLASLGVLGNDLGGLVFSFGALLGLGLWALRRLDMQDFRAWLRRQRRLILTLEALFLVAFSGWALVRAANPDLFGTEKPMELAFINAILQSPAFPPSDPWLSGYAISYYYFGYVLAAMLARISGVVSGGVAFNLAISMVFALAILGAYGVVYDLLAREEGNPGEQGQGNTTTRRIPARFAALLGPLLAILSGNLVGLLEVLHHRGIFWRAGPDGTLRSSFWTWLDLRELSQPPVEPLSWLPRLFGTGEWWWWRASRVVQDYDLAGTWREVIDEFPIFSFLLADLHPHVLAIPFAFLAVALALNLYLGGARGSFAWGPVSLQLPGEHVLFLALSLGGLAFLNTWDFPIYLMLVAGAYLLFQARLKGWGWARLTDFVTITLTLGLVGVVLYLPFYTGFSSQAGGFIPNLIYITRGGHLWVMFGLFFVLLFPYLLYRWRVSGGQIKTGLLAAAGLLAGLYILALLGGLVAVSLPVVGDLYLSAMGASGASRELFQESLVRRTLQPGTWLTMLGILALTLGLLWPRVSNHTREQESPPSPEAFALLLILFASLLVIGPEFFYLRDQFGWRINTIFKFYYQAWLLWGLASAYAASVLLARISGAGRVAFQAALVVVLGVGLIYPVLGTWDRARGFQPDLGWSLDGTLRSSYLGPDDAAAVTWLRGASYGVLAEAVGGSYTSFGRISATSGYPSVLGWPGHESQWRGGYREIGSREEDIQRLYVSRNWEEAADILRKYQIRYVYVGPLERAKYPVYEPKFQRFLTSVYRNDQVVIYEVPGGL